MARHRPGRSPAMKSTPCHQAPCRHSAARPSAAHHQHTPLRTDFIPSWLQHVQASYNDSSREAPWEASHGDAPETSWHPNGIPNVRIQSTCDAGGYQSSDLFIQDSPSPAPSAIQTSRHHHRESDLYSDYDMISVDKEGGYRSRTTISTPPPASVVKDDVFEKRPRRKTRQDRYDTVKFKDAAPTKKQAQRRSTRVSKSGRLRSSREVMANFKSRAITNPNERITLKSTFTPGLFVNGRSSAPVADLVFNEIPLPDEDGEPIERNRSSNSRSRRSKEERARREDVDYLANALKRLREDYPAPELSGSRSISILSGGDFPSCQRSSTADVFGDEAAARETGPMSHFEGLDGGGASDKGDSSRLRSLPDDHIQQNYSVRSRSAVNKAPFSNSNMLKTPTHVDGDTRSSDQKKSLAEQPDPEPIVSRGDVRSYGSQTVKIPDYQDKGVMVSPGLYQRTEIPKPIDPDYGNQPLCPDEGCFPNVGAEIHCPHAIPQIPVLGADQGNASPNRRVPATSISNTNSNIPGFSTHLPGVSANLDFATVAKDAPSSHSGPSPAWFFGRPSSQYPFPTLESYANPTSRLVGDYGTLTSCNTQSKISNHPGILIEPTDPRLVFSISQETHHDPDSLCTTALQEEEDVPEESLTKYIERMEREILGPDETSSLSIDDELYSGQPSSHNPVHDVPHTAATQLHDGYLYKSNVLHSPGGLLQRPPHEALGRPVHQNQPLSESVDGMGDRTEPELASFWRPNYMMWY
ncbi:hypothetical protein HDV57DRAFT_27687 [Trichoderma longibrachiatum]